MAGNFILARDLVAFRKDDQQACEWVASVILDPQTPPPGQTIAHWALYWGSYDTGLGTLSSTGWIVVADMTTPQTPNDVDAWIAEPVGDGFTLPIAEKPWNCLSTNVLQALDGGLGFPNTVTVAPFWP
jgi:hypothetical protein